MNTAEILRAAANRVREGWAQKWSGEWKGEPVCALGAVRLAAKDRACIRDSAVCSAVGEVIARALALPPVSFSMRDCQKYRVVEWNDMDGQTAENVAAGLEYAALYWEQEQAQRHDEQPSDPAVATPVAEGKAPQFA